MWQVLIAVADKDTVSRFMVLMSSLSNKEAVSCSCVSRFMNEIKQLFSVINLYAPRILYIGQTYRYSPVGTMHPVYRTDVPLLPRVFFLYIYSTNIFSYFLDSLSPSSFISPQNVVYFLMLSFLVRKIFTFSINCVLNCKCPASGPKS